MPAPNHGDRMDARRDATHGMNPGGGGGQKGVTADRSGGPGDRKRELPPPPAKIPGIPSEVDPKIFQALRTAADTDDYFSNLQAIALGGLGSQQALANFSVAPEQNYFDYRTSTPEFGPLGSTKSLEDGGISIAEIFRKLSEMSLNAPVTQYAEGGRADAGGRGNDRYRERPRPTSGETTDLTDFGNMIQALMLMTPETRDVESPFGGPDKPRARRPSSEDIPGGLMPRNIPARPPVSQRQVRMPVDNEPMDIIPDAFFDRYQPELITQEALDAPVAPSVPPLPSEKPEAPIRPRPELIEDRLGNELSSARVNPSTVRRTEGPSSYEQALQMFIDRRDATGGGPPPNAYPRTQDQRFEDLENFSDPQFDDDMDEISARLFPFEGGPTALLAAKLGSQPTQSGQQSGQPIKNDSAQQISSGGSGTISSDTPMSDPVFEETSDNNDADRLTVFSSYPDSEGSNDVVDLLRVFGHSNNNQDSESLQNERTEILDNISTLEESDPQQVDPVYGLGGYSDKNNFNAYSSDETRKIAYYVLRSKGFSPQDAKNRVDSMTSDELGQMESMGFAGGGQVRGRRDALPMVEGDHVVPAHAVKGNEGGLAALSKKLMGNQSYDGMIRGPGGPREDAIKTRVYAAGGGISGKMDNLQNPFNSVPARVSDKEYVIPRQAITNLGMMHGAREGDANKAGQDIIYQMVENLKRKA